MDFYLFILLTGFAVVMGLVGARSLAFGSISAITFFVLGVLLLSQGLTQTAVFYNESSGQVVVQEVQLLSPPLDIFVPLLFIFTGATTFLIGWRIGRRREVFSYG